MSGNFHYDLIHNFISLFFDNYFSHLIFNYVANRGMFEMSSADK